MARKASFLGIPRELRQMIYHYVLRFDLNYKIVERYGNELKRNFCYTRMYRHHDNTPTVPWVNLLLTCKYINIEVDAYMSLHINEDTHTYTIDIDASYRGFLRSSTLRNIPCSPSTVNTVLANILIDFDPRPECFEIARHSGFTTIVRQLYQTLNLLLHNGPILSRDFPLRQPLKLKNLDIYTIVTSDYHSMFRYDGLEWIIGWTFRQIIRTGLLRGYVDYVHLINQDGHITEFAIQPVEIAGAPTAWTGYGFEWGPNHENSVKWITLDDEKTAQ
ncbi:hypothetical protein F4803DRAFT_557204 [Xylaria telfairii]|nr:hypothetical protein F4803DRAFT_557204 [Xylaria telfairii]